MIPLESSEAETSYHKRILFVCLFNLQRSVIAEGMFRKLLAADGSSDADGIDVTSAGFIGPGVKAWFRDMRLDIPEPIFGREMPGATRNSLLARGLDVSAYRSRTADGDLLASSDLVICMLPEIRRDMIDVYPEVEPRAFILQDFLDDDTQFYWEKTDTFPHDNTYYEFVHNDQVYVDVVIGQLEESLGRAYPQILARLRGRETTGGPSQ